MIELAEPLVLLCRLVNLLSSPLGTVNSACVSQDKVNACTDGYLLQQRAGQES